MKFYHLKYILIKKKDLFSYLCWFYALLNGSTYVWLDGIIRWLDGRAYEHYLDALFIELLDNIEDCRFQKFVSIGFKCPWLIVAGKASSDIV